MGRTYGHQMEGRRAMSAPFWTPNPAPAPNRRPPFPPGALGESDCLVCAPPASPAAVGQAQRRLALAANFWHRIAMRNSRRREFSVVVKRDEEGFYVASVPELRGCHTQARSLDKLMERVREAIELCLDVEGNLPSKTEFIGVQRVAV